MRDNGGFRIELDRIINGNNEAVREFLNWLKDNDNISEYETEYATTEVAFGGLVYGHDPKWYRLRGMFIDFLDFNNIHVNVWYQVYTYTWGIARSEYDFIEQPAYETRAEAEAAGITEAFSVLQNRIKVPELIKTDKP